MGLARSKELPQPQSRRTLFASAGLGVVDFCCRASVEPTGPEEPSPTHSIVFVRQGVFRRSLRDETLVADANHVLFFNAGESYRYAHPVAGGDDCTVLAMDAQRALELVRRYAPAEAEDPECPFRMGSALASPRAARLHYDVLRLARTPAPALAVEDAVAELADEAVGDAHRARGVRAGPAGSTSARRRWREVVDAAQVIVNARLESLPSLAGLAAELGCSAFHLSRIFHAVAGSSLRAYVGRLRARLGAASLAAGGDDLTVLALRLGYADHSHFTNAFRGEWGVPPSRFREAHRPSKILQARRPAGSELGLRGR